MRAVPLLLAALVAGTAAADFAGVDGFSGRVADCTSCHTPSPLAGPATVRLEGLPEAWRPGEEHHLTVTVAGGPPALPAPQPQGGFELEAGAGTLAVPPGMEGLLRQASPTVMTYTPDGTLHRTWNVTWTAPDLRAPPEAVGFWLAAVSANGNHVVATNASDAGEHGDQVATLTATVPPHPDAHDAWRALPLAPPSLATPAGLRLEGRHEDGNATHLAWRFGDGEWQRRTTGTAWRLRLDAAPAGVLELRSEGAGRASPSLYVTFQDGTAAVHDAAPGPTRDSPAPPWPALAFLLLARRRP